MKLLNRSLPRFLAPAAGLALAIFVSGLAQDRPAQAAFRAELGGEVRVGQLVPSFYGGVVFEDCNGKRWTVAGASLEWTGEGCPAGASSQVPATGWGDPRVAPKPGGTAAGEPIPEPCIQCNEGPDLVDLLALDKPAPTPCTLCVLTGAETGAELYRYGIDGRAYDAYHMGVDIKGTPPTWAAYQRLLDTQAYGAKSAQPLWVLGSDGVAQAADKGNAPLLVLPKAPKD